MYLQQIRIYSDVHYLPAIQALTRDTQVPVNKALSTKAEMSLFLVGQMEAVTTNIIDRHYYHFINSHDFYSSLGYVTANIYHRTLQCLTLLKV